MIAYGVQMRRGEVFEGPSQVSVEQRQAQTPCVSTAQATAANLSAAQAFILSICKGAICRRLNSQSSTSLPSIISLGFNSCATRSVGGMQAPSFARVSNQHFRMGLQATTLELTPLQLPGFPL
jgi:hypothetical protein